VRQADEVKILERAKYGLVQALVVIYGLRFYDFFRKTVNVTSNFTVNYGVKP
jgi:hypothetical protein